MYLRRRLERSTRLSRSLLYCLVALSPVLTGLARRRTVQAVPEHDEVNSKIYAPKCYVLVTSLSGWGRYVTREYHDWMLELINQHDWKEAEPELFGEHVRGSQTNEDNPVSLKLRHICEGGYPSFLLFVEMYGLIESHPMSTLKSLQQNHAVKLGFWMNDVQVPALRDMGQLRRKLFFNIFDVVYGPYTYLLPVFYPSLGAKNIVWLPNAVALEMQNVTFQDNPEYQRIFVPGALDQLWYPVRTWAAQQVGYQGSIFVTLSHPGYGSHSTHSTKGTDFIHGIYQGVIKANVRGAEYASLSGHFTACLTDLQRVSAVISKHFELPASGCLLLTSNQHVHLLHALGFQDRVNCILYDRNDPMKVIRWVLDPANANRVHQIRRAGYDLIHSKHLIQHRARHIAQDSKSLVFGITRQDAFIAPNMSRKDSCPCPFVAESMCQCYDRWKLAIQSTQAGGEPLVQSEIPPSLKLCS